MRDAMPSKCIGDYVALQRGNTYKSALLGEPGPFLLGLGSIARNGGFKADNLETYGGISDPRILLESGDIYVSLKDVTQSGDLLGSVAKVPDFIHTGRLTQDTVKLVFKSDDEPRNYMYWLLRTPQYRAYCRAHATGTTNLGLSREDFFAFPVPVFTDERATVVELLQTLDDKIELNRRMNETLEALARAIFKSWFVDFDPVRAKAEGGKPFGMGDAIAALFPGRFGPDGLPEGWLRQPVEDLMSRAAMGPFGSRIKTENFVADGVPIIRGQNLVNGFVDDGFVYLTKEKAQELRSAAAYPGDIVFTHRGTLGQVGQIPKEGRYKKYIVSQSQMLLSVNASKTSSRLVYWFFRSPYGQGELLANANPTGVPAIARPLTSLKAIRVITPDLPVVRAFDALVEPLDEKAALNNSESATLAALRDLLLPKLMSGEIGVKDAEQAVDGVSDV